MESNILKESIRITLMASEITAFLRNNRRLLGIIEIMMARWSISRETAQLVFAMYLSTK